MTLFEQWKDLIENQTEETFRDFWEEYSGAETKIYSDILDKPEEKMTGTLGELAAKYEGQENRQKRSMPMRQRQKIQALLR